MNRVIYYIDGLNLYYGFNKNNWQEYNWIDLVKFCGNNLPHGLNNPILKVKYFTSKFDAHSPIGKAQNHFLQANESINRESGKLDIIKGVHKDGYSWCNICQTDTPKKNEKKTDVNIAIHMLEDAVITPICDISVLISNDTDLVPCIKMIRKYKPEHRVVILVPPTQQTNLDLQHAVKSDVLNNVISFPRNSVSQYISAQLDEEVIVNASFTAKRPDIYNRTWIDAETKRKKEEENETKKLAKLSYKADSSSSISTEKLNELKNKFGNK